MGDYEILVSVDSRIDFLPAAGEEESAIRHMGSDMGHNLDLGSLLKPRDPDESGSVSVRNAYGVRVGQEARESLLAALQSAADATPIEPPPPPVITATGAVSGGTAPPQKFIGADHAPPEWAMRTTAQPRGVIDAGASATPEWAMRTRPISRDDLADVLARRQNRSEARERTVQFHQQASSWQDLGSALQAFCRGAGIEQNSLSAEAQAMLPLIAGQLLREAVVGLSDIAQSRAAAAIGPRNATLPATGSSSNPLRTSTSVEQAIQRLFEAHGRMYGGPVESLRDVLQEAKDHEVATLAAMRGALDGMLQQLSPSSIADQFEQGRARSLAPGQDPRPKYWEHYADFYRLLTQQGSNDGNLPHAFVESFGQEYVRARAQIRDKKQDGQ
jgi:type VI secretion system FHA domain protein